MGERTEIGWTDHTFNPWWGCIRVSAACQFCYAESLSKRWGYDIWGPTTERRFFGEKHWAEPLKWDRLAERDGVRRRVFCASMADVFEDRDDLFDPRDRLFDLIEDTRNLDWQLLTKRPENIIRFMPDHWPAFPPNVWLGVTVENQAAADERIPLLLQTPAAVRFLSCEPLLGPIDLEPYLWGPSSNNGRGETTWPALGLVSWVIVGGESGGPEERRLVTHLGDRMSGEIWTPKPAALGWVRAIKQQCLDAEVPLFFKQWGGPTPKSGGRLLDGRTWDEFPDTKGA